MTVRVQTSLQLHWIYVWEYEEDEGFLFFFSLLLWTYMTHTVQSSQDSAM